MSKGFYSFSDYKKIAHQYLTKHGLLAKGVLPVDIEALIDKSGITIHVVPLMFKDFGVKGAVLKTVGGYDIAIDETLFEEQEFYYRFTLAEELSHILLHGSHVAGISSLEDVQKFHQSFTDEQYKVIEQEARTLASQLLLPSQLFDPYILDWVAKHLPALQASAFFSRNDLAQYIADGTYRGLKISVDCVRHSILRFPNAAIDQVLSTYGQALIQ